MSVLEGVGHAVLPWIPLYYEAKLVFVLWMTLPQTQGARMIYEDFLAPRLAAWKRQLAGQLQGQGQGEQAGGPGAAAATHNEERAAGGSGGGGGGGSSSSRFGLKSLFRRTPKSSEGAAGAAGGLASAGGSGSGAAAAAALDAQGSGGGDTHNYSPLSTNLQ
ncbi:hypothetical protein HXX76_002768 [Chlamydomonas incerta]|uniref:HVA22-like protein n=1 Tax=Chlamydomonas incerta TaxID=51695 RepID=A0A835TR54_CHLIN|nr:hypothetical protein HXX76_002768 [Chlamydomonas incerta]|eukprot:KAG2442685.1 hypothetical protein HXX76_002768 [Chlamydomonas incerta]